MGKKPQTPRTGQTDMPEWVQPPQVNGKYDVVMKLSVFGTQTDTHTRQNLHILAMRAVTIYLADYITLDYSSFT